MGIVASVYPSKAYAQGLTPCGEIQAGEVWPGDGAVHSVTCDIIIPEDRTLLVEAGAIIKLNNDSSVFVNGTLRVLGTAANPVYFTSYRDDLIGGDTNGDGTSTGAVEDWGRIHFNSTSDDANSIIEHSVIRYSGNDGFYSNNDFGAIGLDNASPTLRNITFESNFINGAEIVGGDWQSDIWDNPDVVYYVTSDLVVPIADTLTITSGMRVHFLSDVTVANNATLVFQPGVIAKFGLDDSLFVNGALRVLGRADNPVYFTSTRDDAVGGDTNGDGAATTPAVEDWGRVQFNTDSDDANSQMENLVIRYSGNDGFYTTNDFGAIRLDNASPTLRNIT